MNLASSLKRKMERMGRMGAKFFEPPSSSFQGGLHISHQASLLPEERGCNRPQCCFSKIIPSFFTIKEGSTILTKPLFNSLYAPFGSPVNGGQKPQGRRGKPPSGARNRYAIRLAGHQSPRHGCAGWDRLRKGGDSMGWTCYNRVIDC